MVVVYPDNKIVNIGSTFLLEGILYKVASIVPPENGNAGYLLIQDTTNNKTHKIYATKIGGKWSNSSTYNKPAKFTKILPKK